VQTTLDDNDILASFRKRELSTVAKVRCGRAVVFSQQCPRQVHALHVVKPLALQSVEAIPAAAEKLHDFGIARPLAGS